ncbi:unnamed protein product [Darwinula stevensoni]|uniref:Kinesin-like protein n=1 Tax=Darwinula stevensoni TaxID=69355 RepID=A0A7R9FNN8_9CRUS|nr:unnamed protein product [Darwinula stevensoni]CAG0896914.1 unnamed protein product [Darwinula stevensoni]
MIVGLSEWPALEVLPRRKKWLGVEEPEFLNVVKCLRVEGDHIVEVAPVDSATYKQILNRQGNRNAHVLQETRYTFSQIFGPETAQEDVFQDVITHGFPDITSSRNFLVFSYGTTNGGKTYTMQEGSSFNVNDEGLRVLTPESEAPSTDQNPGLIPRIVGHVFESLKHPVAHGFSFKPHAATGVLQLSMKEQEEQERTKRETLALATSVSSSLLSSFTCSTTSGDGDGNGDASHMQLDDPSTLERKLPGYEVSDSSLYISQGIGVQHSIWVSFVEIYNEQIYDLLVSRPPGAKQPSLKLGRNRGVTYIKGVREVCVHSMEEAMRLFLIGSQNLRFASTKINPHSSRSHSLFRIQILTVKAFHHPPDVQISTIQFIDLAGSERAEKTENVGDRLAEASSVNKGLLALGNVLRSFKNQEVNPKTLVPFRNSRLTEILENFLSTQRENTKVTMVLNISPDVYLFDETHHALKFGALAKSVKTTHVRGPERIANSKFGLFVRRSLVAIENQIPQQQRSVPFNGFNKFQKMETHQKRDGAVNVCETVKFSAGTKTSDPPLPFSERFETTTGV